MTLLKKIITTAILAAVAITAGALMIYDFDDAELKYCEAGVYDMLNPELIEMYETEIAGEPIVSDKSETQLNRVAGRLGISVQKLKAIMLLQDLAGKAGQNVSLSDLAEMSDIKLLTAFKEWGKSYLSTLPDERRAEIEQKLKGALKLK